MTDSPRQESAGQSASSVPPYEIKSRPEYGVLEPVLEAQQNIIIAEGERGMEAVQRMLDRAPSGFSERSLVIRVDAEGAVSERDLAPMVEALRGASMGTRLYVAGGESFLGRAIQVAQDHGVNPASVITELTGSLARRVQCVHCKTITEGVTRASYTCPHCGADLVVRDHYSRRLAAFQAVSGTAEDPADEVPEEKIFGGTQ